MPNTPDPRIATAASATVVPIDTLRPWDRNPHRGDVDVVRASLRRFGQVTPIVRAPDGWIIAGNTTLKAMIAEGFTECVVVTMDAAEVEQMAFGLASNQTARRGEDDQVQVLALLREIEAYDAGIDGLGYEADDLAAMEAIAAQLDSLDAYADLPRGTWDGGGEPVDDERDATRERPAITGDADEVPEAAPPTTVRGDVWLLGEHRVMCGDCRDPHDVATLLDGATVHLAFTSPPYADRRPYDESSGFRPIHPDAYVEWFRPVADIVRQHLASDGSWFVNIKPTAEGLDTSLYVHDLVAAHVREWGWHWLTEFCWERMGMPKAVVFRFKNQFEPIYQFVLDRFKFHPDRVRHASDNVPMPYGPGAGDTSWANRQGNGESPFGPRGRGVTFSREQGTPTAQFDREDVAPGLAYPGNRLPTFNGSHQATGHSAAFPVGLPERFVIVYTDEGDNVYDPFVGSGSTILAAHLQNRRGYGMEVSPQYVDIVCRRWQERTGIIPRRASTGEPVDFLAPAEP